MTTENKQRRQAIRITCAGTGTIQLEEVKGIQGSLKTISRKNLEKLKNRILKHGFNVPLHVWQHEGKSYLLDGHQRTKALLELQAQGYDVPPLPYDVIQADNLEDAKDKLLGISSQYGDITMDGLRDFAVGVEIDQDLRLPNGELRIDALQVETASTDDDAPKASPRISKVGDLWDIGQHRLIVGDSTSRDVIKELMQDQLAQLVFTDPPYGVQYDDSKRGGHNGGILNDREDNLKTGILIPSLTLAVKHTLEDAAFYIWHASTTRKDFEEAIAAVGLEERQYIIWVKPFIIISRSDYHWQHEPCFYCSKHGITPRWIGDRQQSTVWTATYRGDGTGSVVIANGVTLVGDNGSQIYIQRDSPKSKKKRAVRVYKDETVYLSSIEGSDVWEVKQDSMNQYMHPNQKPVELPTRAIVNHTNPGEIVLDNFAGSGSTLIAAQRTGRIFRGAELDPKWADIIIKRWCLWMVKNSLTPEIKRNGKLYDWTKFCPEVQEHGHKA